MTELTRIRLRTLGWFVLFPVTFMGLLPWWLHQRFEGPFAWDGTLRQWIGVWLIGNGLGLAGWCVNLFNVEGRGTPLPVDPPTRYVVRGPYQVVRNPMALGIFLVLGGQALLYHSRAVLLCLLLVMAFMHLFVVLVEEPQLERRFGATYSAYKRQIPRWIPRPFDAVDRRGV
jgi:protein-S-isoprenylcysteine O-methyltransferase Ste14